MLGVDKDVEELELITLLVGMLNGANLENWYFSIKHIHLHITQQSLTPRFIKMKLKAVFTQKSVCEQFIVVICNHHNSKTFKYPLIWKDFKTVYTEPEQIIQKNLYEITKTQDCQSNPEKIRKVITSTSDNDTYKATVINTVWY